MDFLVIRKIRNSFHPININSAPLFRLLEILHQLFSVSSCLEENINRYHVQGINLEAMIGYDNKHT